MRYTLKQGDLLLVTPPVPLSDLALDALLGELVGHLARNQPYALIFDMTRAEIPSPLQRRKLSEHLRTNDSAIRRNVLGIALVAPSAALRGIATAVFWLFPPPVQWRTFDLLDEATLWAQSLGKS